MIGDAPTQSLLDPDHPLAREAVGTQGVSLCRKQDFFDLYRGVRFDQVSISSSVPAFFALAGLVLSAREAGFPLDRLRGSNSSRTLIFGGLLLRLPSPGGVSDATSRSIRSSIVRVTCRNFMPTSRTPISSASAA